MTHPRDYQAKPLPFTQELTGISKRTIEIHHDKLYVGYVSKLKELSVKIADTDETALANANASYSELRALRDSETFVTNAVYLHEHYFDILGGNGKAKGPLVDAIKEKWSSLENFITRFSAAGMAMRGWVVLSWDTHLGGLKTYGCDAHNQGGIWGAIPIIVLDVYEHAYFIDYGSDRKAYIVDFWKNFNWEAANQKFEQVKNIKL